MPTVTRSNTKDKPKPNQLAEHIALRDRLQEAGIDVRAEEIISWTADQRLAAETFALAKLAVLAGPPAFLPQPDLEIPETEGQAADVHAECIGLGSYGAFVHRWIDQAREVGDAATDAELAFEDALNEPSDMEECREAAREAVRLTTRRLRALVRDLQDEGAMVRRLGR